MQSLSNPPENFRRLPDCRMVLRSVLVEPPADMGSGQPTAWALSDAVSPRWHRRPAKCRRYRMTVNGVDLKPGSLRATVPLYATWVIDSGALEVSGRFQIGPEVILARLNASESERIRRYWAGRLPPPAWRLEVHGVDASNLAGVELSVRRAIAQLSLAVRVSPWWVAIAVDRWNGTNWVRLGSCGTGGGVEGTTHIPVERLKTANVLRQRWRGNLPNQVWQSLDYYHESVLELWRVHLGKALLMASISFESLLGGGLSSELSYRLALRGALLVATGDDTTLVHKRLRSIYGRRSKVVHEAQDADFATVTHLQQYLMRALPSMVELLNSAGGYEKAIALIDESVFAVQPELMALMDASPDWWSYVDVAACFASDPLPRGRFSGEWAHDNWFGIV